MWKWFRWVLMSFGIVIVLFVTAFLYFVKPFANPKQEDVAIPVFKDPKCTRQFSPQFSAAPYYEGPLFDSHFHFPPTFDHTESGSKFPILGKNITIDDIICELEKEKVVGSTAFYFPNFWMLSGGTTQEDFNKLVVGEASKIKNGIPNWMHLFFEPEPLSAKDVSSIYNSSRGTFEGFGEIVYFFPASPRFFSKVDDEKALAIEKIANDNKLLIMVHPSQGQRENLENALKQNPDATFILHGWEHDDYVWELINDYPNLYFTLDAATLYPIYGKIDSSAEKFIPSFKKDFKSILERDETKWKQQIERNPDRFMWGTDRYFDWHYGESASLLFEEFARAFIGRLDPNVQEKFAYENAQNLFLNSSLRNTREQKVEERNSNLGELPEAVRLCIIEKIGEANWRIISTGSRRATSEEEQAISQCHQ